MAATSKTLLGVGEDGKQRNGLWLLLDGRLRLVVQNLARCKLLELGVVERRCEVVKARAKPQRCVVDLNMTISFLPHKSKRSSCDVVYP